MAEIELMPASIALSIGATPDIQVWGDYGNGTKSQLYISPSAAITYSSSNPNVADVDSLGRLTLKAAGSAALTVSYLGFSAHTTVTVSALPAPPVIVRAIGPSSSAAGLSGVLANPYLELHESSGLTIATNDNRVDSPNKEAISESAVAPTNNKESAILMTLNPSAYTAIVSGMNATTGVGLVEVYDLDQTLDCKLANISTRGLVGTDDNVLIGGFIVLGKDPTNTVVRAIGPSLPLSGTLADPTMEARSSLRTTTGKTRKRRLSKRRQFHPLMMPSQRSSRHFHRALTLRLFAVRITRQEWR